MIIIREGKANLKYIFVVIVLTALTGGGILVYQYRGWPEQKIELPKEVQSDDVKIPVFEPPEETQTCPSYGSQVLIILDKRPGGIMGSKEIEGQFYEAEDSAYQHYYEYYEIGENTRIILEHRTKTEPNIKAFADVILEKGKERFALVSNKELSPIGERFYVCTTNIPDIFLLGFESGDIGQWLTSEFYLDVAKNEIVFTIIDENEYAIKGNNLTVEKKGGLIANLDFKVVDNCGDISEERTGKKAQIVDLLLNDQAANILQKPIEIDCISVNSPGSYDIYNPSIYLVKRKIESDFSKLYFDLMGLQWSRSDKNEQPKEVWKQEFYITLTGPNDIKIYRK